MRNPHAYESLGVLLSGAGARVNGHISPWAEVALEFPSRRLPIVAFYFHSKNRKMTDANFEGDAAVDELINKAYQLAYFIHDDRAIAVHVALAAFRKLKVASTAQGRRVYYTPTGQSGYRAARTKVSLSDLHILQRLVYIESEIYERMEEEKQNESPGQMGMIIRFIKHLIKISVKRNSFYVSLGLSRVLHNFTTSEAMEIYGSVVQDPERARENYYYRSQKACLMQELKERFGDMLRIRIAKQGEYRFEAQEEPSHYLELVRNCLLQFMPWQSKCVLPSDFDPLKREVVPLLFEGSHPDEEHVIELNRIHTLLHPDCFRRLVTALGLDLPDRRLEVPYFFLSHNDPGSLGRRLNPPSLSDEELYVISDRINKESARRKKNSGRLLSILVDGIERDQLDLNRTNNLRLEIKADAELIEVRELDSTEETLLATYLVPHDEAGAAPLKSEVLLEGGQALSFEVLGTDKSSSGTLIGIKYRETRPLKAISLRFRRLTFNYIPAFNIQELMRAVASKPAKILLSLLLGISTLIVFFQLTDNRERTLVSVQEKPATPDERERQQEIPKVALPSSESTSPNTNKQQQGSASAHDDSINANSDAERTRAPKTRTNLVALLDVKRIYVNIGGSEPLRQQLLELLNKGLQSMNRFDLVPRQEADAMLDISEIQVLDGGRVSVIVELVNRQGQVLWPRRGKKAYSGHPADVTVRLLNDLQNDIRRMEKKL